MQKIVELLNNYKRCDPKRGYIGASGIGHPCSRKIWYELKYPEDKSIKSARVIRILEMGDMIEEMLLTHLERLGLKVLRLKKHLVDDELKYFGGHVDAILPDDEVVLEIKSAKDSSFKLFQNKGLKGWWPAYHAQVQCYMAFTNLRKACVLALNKDTADLHAEIVDYDPEEYAKLKHKAQAIYNSDSEPPRISENPTWFQCKMCDFQRQCHNIND